MKIDDSYIVLLFYTKNGNGPLNSQLRRKLIANKLDRSIKTYLLNRYTDSKSLVETLFRIKYHIEQRPHCTTPGCTNEVTFNGTKKKPYMLHCSCSCTQKDKIVREKLENTCLSLYNCKNSMQSSIIKNKIKKSVEEKYGKGITNVWQAKEIQEKSKQTLLKKFGVDNIAKSDYSKQKHMDCVELTVAKRNATKRQRHTFNTSKLEDKCYDLLVAKFGIDDVKRQYKSELYPFECDFYIISRDLYIEYNGSWTHGKHAFDNTNENDLAIVEKWKAKNTKYYYIAINTWTKRDVNKRNIAKLNIINYKEFWTIKELEEYLKEEN